MSHSQLKLEFCLMGQGKLRLFDNFLFCVIIAGVSGLFGLLIILQLLYFYKNRKNDAIQRRHPEFIYVCGYTSLTYFLISIPLLTIFPTYLTVTIWYFTRITIFCVWLFCLTCRSWLLHFDYHYANAMRLKKVASERAPITKWFKKQNSVSFHE